MCGYEVEVDITTPNPSGPVPAHISCAVMGQNPDPGPGKKYIVQTGYCRDTDPSLVQCGWVTTPQVCQCNTNPLDLP